MFTWVASFFNRNSNMHPVWTHMTFEEVDQMMEKLIQEEEVKEEVRHMQFVCALSNELYPGDNSAVDRVETAIKNALLIIAEND